MTNIQLALIAEVADMLHKGMNNPIKINQAYKYINPSQNMEVPIRVKMNAVNRYMAFNYDDELKRLQKENEKYDKEVEKVFPNFYSESIGTVENKHKQTHIENLDIEINQFLTKAEKEDLANNESGTKLVVKRGRPKNER